MKKLIYVFVALFCLTGCEKKTPPQQIVPKPTGVNNYIKGMEELKKGQVDTAKNLFENRIHDKKEDISSYVALANIQIANKEYEKARDILEQAIKQKTTNPSVYFLLSKCYANTNNVEKAIVTIKKAIDIYREGNNRAEYEQAYKILKLLEESRDKGSKKGPPPNAVPEQGPTESQQLNQEITRPNNNS